MIECGGVNRVRGKACDAFDTWRSVDQIQDPIQDPLIDKLSAFLIIDAFVCSNRNAMRYNSFSFLT